MQRRNFLCGGASMAVALALSPAPTHARAAIEIAMSGRPDGSAVWFTPRGLLIRPGQTIRWINRDRGNSHTATAYHPDNNDRSRRIPEGAASFDSDYLLPGESFETTLKKTGVYDYYCLPHEMAGMVGRIIVAEPDQTEFADYGRGDLPTAALDALPLITDIFKQQRIGHGEG